MMLGYSLLLALGVVVGSPWWLARMLTTDRYREGLAQRLGFVPAALRETVRGKRVVWLHAVSVGEVLAATRLVAELEAALTTTPSMQPWTVVVSTTTRTGQKLACARFGAERVFYMPLDFAFTVRAYLNVLNPSALILMESELWPRLLHECRSRNIPVVVANARISDRSFRRAMKVRALWSRVLRLPTLFLAQSEETAERLGRLLQSNATPTRRHPEEHRDEGPPHSFAAAPTIVVTGNLKYDVRAPKQSRVAELIREVAAGRPIIVAGSVVDDPKSDSWEDDIVIHSWVGKVALDYRALLVVAPRHPEKFKRTESLAMSYRYVRASDWNNDKAKSYPVEGQPGWADQYDELEIVLLDTIGDLAGTYSIATIAFVGGSLVRRGGHNPLEPAQFGVPVVIGPSFENFRDIVTTMQSADAIRIVQNGYELEQAFRELLTNSESARALGERGRAVFESQQGATARSVAAIVSMMGPRA